MHGCANALAVSHLRVLLFTSGSLEEGLCSKSSSAQKDVDQAGTIRLNCSFGRLRMTRTVQVGFQVLNM